MQERPGYEWVPAGSGGFWKKVKGSTHGHKLEFFCPHCNRITGTIDDKYLLDYGFCSVCYVEHVEGREKPTIDLDFYRPKRP